MAEIKEGVGQPVAPLIVAEARDGKKPGWIAGLPTKLIVIEGGPVRILNAILYQFRIISLGWWIAIGVTAIILFSLRHRKDQLIDNLLAIYVIIIIASTVFSREYIQHDGISDLINLDLIGTWIKRATGTFPSRSELFLNFFMLMPVGMLFPLATKKGYLYTTLIGLSLIIVIELLQLFTGRGWFELTDIVDNTIGVMIGYALFRASAAVWRRVKC